MSGHRRWLAAKDLGFDTVPVRYVEFDTPLDELDLLIQLNSQRNKSPGQVVNEYEKALEITEVRADKRRKANLRRGDERPDPQNFAGRERGESRERAAEKIDAAVTGETLRKGKKVKDKAESEDAPEPVREAAQEAWGSR